MIEQMNEDKDQIMFRASLLIWLRVGVRVNTEIVLTKKRQLTLLSHPNMLLE